MPSNSTLKQFFYTYVLFSHKDGKRYIGYTNNLQKRIAEHMPVGTFQQLRVDRLVLFIARLVCPKKMPDNVKNILKQRLVEDI